MKIYDSSRRAKVDFVPLEEGVVRMYVCGPTVYDQIHIGNARTFLSFDVIRRWLVASGYRVTMVQNLTDVDDKIINRAAEQGVDTRELSSRYAQAFIEQMHRLGVMDPDIRPCATQEIGAMVQMISQLVERGHAYATPSGVYFSVRSDEDYGHVSNRDVEAQLSGARVETGENKRDPLDFVLWKAAKPGEPTWDSPWGPGRPGWHTECAAMVQRYLGTPIDIHGGGSDLAFPHHENESAQAECCWGRDFANHWMHTGMLLVDGEKMSKSLGNFFTLKEVLDQYPADALRLLMLQTHYRTALDFSYERLRGAVGSLERIRTAAANLAWAADRRAGGSGGQAGAGPADGNPAGGAGLAGDELGRAVKRARAAFTSCMDDDFNTAGAVASVFELVSAANQCLEHPQDVSAASLRAASGALAELTGALGISSVAAGEEGAGDDDLPAQLLALAAGHGCYQGQDTAQAAQALVGLRQDARARRDWATADAIRDELAGLGLSIEDTPDGPRVKRS